MTDPKELLEPTIIFGAQEHHPSGDPYAKGFKERDLGGDGGIRQTHVTVQQPTLRQRLTNLFWSTAAVMAAMFVIKHYDAIEATMITAYNGVAQLAGLGG